MHHKKHLPVKMFFGMNFLNFQYNFFDILNSKMITNISQLITSYSVGKGSKEIQLSEGVYIVSTSQYGGWDQTNKSYLVFASSYPQTNKIVELDSFPSQWISATISDKGLLTVSNKSDARIFASVFKIGGVNK